MPQFSLPDIQSGGSQTITANTLADAQAQAQNAGTWNPGAGTYGANSILGSGGTNSPTGAGTPQGTSDPLSALQQFASQTSGVTQKQLEQQKAEFDAQLQFAQQQMQQLGIPQLQINQFLAQMQQQQFQSQLALAQQAQAYNQAATTAGLTGWYTPPAGVPNVSGYTSQPTWQPGQQFQAGAPPTTGAATGAAGGAPAGGAASPLAQYAPGSVVRTAGNQFGVVGPNGSLTPGDASNPTIYAAIQRNSGINTISDAAFTAAQRVAATAAAAPNAVTPVDPSAFFQQDAQTQALYTQYHGANAASDWASDATKAVQAAVDAARGSTAQPGAATGQAGQAATGQTTTAPGQPAPGAQMTMQLGQLLGQYNGVPTEAASEYARSLAEQQRQYNLTLGLQQGQLGQQYLSTAAQLQGPQNTFQLSNYLRGAQGNQAVPTYLQNLAANIGTPMFQGAGSTAPTVQSAAGIASQLGGGSSATPGWDYNQTLNTIQNIMSGAQKLAPGSVEQLTPDELQALGSGIGAAGGSLPSFLAQYNASRVGQAAPTARTTLA